MKANIGLTAKESSAAADFLTKLLADEFVLFSKLLNAHWNVEGPDFHPAHIYLDELYHEQLEIVDSVAEYVRYVGHYVPANLKSYLELTHLSEKYEGKNTSLGYYKDLTEAIDAIIIYIRENVDDMEDKYHAQGVANFVTDLMEKHEKTAWMLRSHLK